MEEAVYEKMYELERRHWWFCTKRGIVLTLLHRFLPPTPENPRPKVVDVGCGCGMMAVDLEADGYEALGLDSSDTALEFCRARGLTVKKVSLPGPLPLEDESFDALLLLDVLEHIQDDAASLATAMRAVKPGGIAICTVPAHPFLWTAGDDFLHHVRRYTKKSYRELMNSSSAFRPLMLSYMFSLTFPLAVAQRLMLKASPEKARAAQVEIPGAMINGVLARVSAVEKHLLKRQLPMPPGLSLVCVLRRN